MLLNALLVSIPAILALQVAYPDLEGAERLPQPQVAVACVWVQVSKDLEHRPGAAQDINRFATIGLLSEISTILIARGGTVYAKNGDQIVTPRYGNASSNPQCKNSTPYQVDLKYEATEKKSTFRIHTLIMRNGEIVKSGDEVVNFQDEPEVHLANSFRYHFGKDLQFRARLIVDALFH